MTDEIKSKDYYGLEISIGDVVSFPSSGTMETGKVILKSGNWIAIMNSSGYKKHKKSTNVINNTVIIDILKDKYPENYV